MLRPELGGVHRQRRQHRHQCRAEHAHRLLAETQERDHQDDREFVQDEQRETDRGQRDQYAGTVGVVRAELQVRLDALADRLVVVAVRDGDIREHGRRLRVGLRVTAVALPVHDERTAVAALDGDVTVGLTAGGHPPETGKACDHRRYERQRHQQADDSHDQTRRAFEGHRDTLRDPRRIRYRPTSSLILADRTSLTLSPMCATSTAAATAG
jgi:hypothetical protein